MAHGARRVWAAVWIVLALAFCVSLVFAGPPVAGSAAHYRPGEATAVDGDTVKFKDGRVCRLVGIDAPESHQPFGALARSVVTQLVAGEVGVLVYGQDKYRRDLCWLTNGAISINAELVRQGLAETYLLTRAPFGSTLQLLESEAKAAGRGMWSLPASEYESPSVYRHRIKSQSAPRPPGG